MLGQSAEAGLRRTVYLEGLSVSTTADDFGSLLNKLPGVTEHEMGESADGKGKFALLEFERVQDAESLLLRVDLSVRGRLLRVAPSKRTVVAYTPSDVVFGKPMTIGRHVMAVNPTNVTSALREKRERSMKRFRDVVDSLLDVAQDEGGPQGGRGVRAEGSKRRR